VIDRAITLEMAYNPNDCVELPRDMAACSLAARAHQPAMPAVGFLEALAWLLVRSGADFDQEALDPAELAYTLHDEASAPDDDGRQSGGIAVPPLAYLQADQQWALV
jgi:hypothetical protein